MTHLIIVEGITDKGVIQKIAEKLGIKTKILLMRGNRPNKAIRLANAELNTRKYTKVIILKDQHQQPENEIHKKLNTIAKNIQHPKTYTILVKKAIEAWILAGLGINNPENINDPTTQLDHILRQKGKRYIKSLKTAKTLTENLDLQQASQHSQTLKQFIQTLKDP